MNLTRPTRIFKRDDLPDALMVFLPENQHSFSETKAYHALCDALWNYLKSDYDTKEEKRELLSMARLSFDDMCLTTPSPERKLDYSDPTRESPRPWSLR